MRRPSLRLSGGGEPLERGFQVAFGIDQKVGRGHHRVAFGNTVFDLDIAGAAPAKPHRTGLGTSPRLCR